MTFQFQILASVGMNVRPPHHLSPFNILLNFPRSSQPNLQHLGCLAPGLRSVSLLVIEQCKWGVLLDNVLRRKIKGVWEHIKNVYERVMSVLLHTTAPLGPAGRNTIPYDD